MKLPTLIKEDKPPKFDMCKCSECGFSGKITEFYTEMESDGWEYPEYEVQVCPKCEDGGCVDDYWYSDELLPIANEYWDKKLKEWGKL